jgi:hypothetical protein
MTTGNATAGEIGRDEGAKRAVDHAERAVDSRWGTLAYGAVVDYAKNHAHRHPCSEFTSEDVRAASADYVPEPPDARAWGSVYLLAARRGVIEHAGYRKSRSPTRHTGVVGVWRPTGGPRG